MGLFGGLIGDISNAYSQGSIGASSISVDKRTQSSQNNRESIDSSVLSEIQKRTLTSFKTVVKEIAREHGASAFADDDKLYEACVGLEGETYRCGRDLLLTIFMKKIPQLFARKRLSSGKISWDAYTDDILTDELGMNSIFANKLLSILQTQLENCKKG